MIILRLGVTSDFAQVRAGVVGLAFVSLHEGVEATPPTTPRTTPRPFGCTYSSEPAHQFPSVPCHTVHPMMTPPLSDAILVVDDDADNREMLAASLQRKGFTVYAAPNGA